MKTQQVLILLLVAHFLGCQKQEAPVAPPTPEDRELLNFALEHFAPLPDSLIDVQQSAGLIELGRTLYHETALSKSGTISCNSCHQLDRFGVDGLPTSPGHDGTFGERNSPTVYNSALHFAQFWDGRAADLKEQALGPLLNPIEHGLKDEQEVIKILEEKGYQKQFEAAFKAPNTLTFENVGVAIEAFEKTLLTPSRFDEYLKGNLNALTPKEKQGMKKFIEVGCTVCHSGPALGGQMYQKLGLVEEYPTKDLGRMAITKDEEDRHVFKVPSLRNIIYTHPYLHDGSIERLQDMIRLMGRYQLGVTLSDQDVDDLFTFMVSLTGTELEKQFSENKD